MAAGPGAIGMALPYKKSGVVDRSLSRGEGHTQTGASVPEHKSFAHSGGTNDLYRPPPGPGGGAPGSLAGATMHSSRCTGEGEVKELGWSLVVQTLVRPTIQLPWPSSSSFRVL